MPSLAEILQSGPLLGLDVEHFSSVQTLKEWVAALLLISASHTAEYVDIVLEVMNSVVSPTLLHGSKRFECAPMLIQNIGVTHEFLTARLITTQHEKLALRVHAEPSQIRHIEFIVNHDGMSHVISNLVGVDKLRSLL